MVSWIDWEIICWGGQITALYIEHLFLSRELIGYSAYKEELDIQYFFKFGVEGSKLLLNQFDVLRTSLPGMY